MKPAMGAATSAMRRTTQDASTAPDLRAADGPVVAADTAGNIQTQYKRPASIKRAFCIAQTDF
jgi:hypothetical protein